MAEGNSGERGYVRHRAPTRGVLDGLAVDGTVCVRVGDRVLRASFATDCSDAELLSAVRRQAEVLIMFLEDDPELPVIVGILRRHLAPATGADVRSERFIDLQAADGIQLRSGDASINLRPDGRIEIRATEILSAAESTHRILGGTVAIN